MTGVYNNPTVPNSTEYSGKKPYQRIHRDHFVTINNSAYVGNDTEIGAPIDVSDHVESISTSANIDSPPSTCDITVRLPLYADESRMFRFMEENFKEMDEVSVFLKNRFKYKSNSKQGYSLVFRGLITQKSANKQSNEYVLTLNCQDMLWWWERMRFNANPALIERANTDKGFSTGVHQTIYGKKNPFEIIYFISKGSEYDLLSNLSAQARTNNGVDSLKNGEVYKRWQLILEDIADKIRIFGVNGVTSDSNYSGDSKRQYYTDLGMSSFGLPNPDKTLPKANLDTGDNLYNTRVNLDRSLLEEVKPFIQFQVPSNFNSEFKSRLEIATETARLIGFEFFQDTDGLIKFKPPLYNMFVSKFENPIYVAQPIDVRDMSFSSDVSEVITELTVRGRLNDQITDNSDSNEAVFALYRDVHLASLYGIQDDHITLSWARNSEQCLQYAIGEMDRYNSRRFKSSITLEGRPELRMGRPFYIESKDEFYYIRGVSHQYDASGSFTTSLELDSRRKRYFNPQSYIPEENGYVDINIKRPEGSSRLSTIVGAGELSYGSGRLIKNIVVTRDSVIKQVSDDFGYEIIGSFGYGRYLKINPDGTIGFRSQSANLKFQNRASAIVEATQAAEAIYIEKQSEHPDITGSEEDSKMDSEGFLSKLGNVVSNMSVRGLLSGDFFSNIADLGSTFSNFTKSENIRDIGKGILSDKVKKSVDTSKTSKKESSLKKKFRF